MLFIFPISQVFDNLKNLSYNSEIMSNLRMRSRGFERREVPFERAIEIGATFPNDEPPPQTVEELEARKIDFYKGILEQGSVVEPVRPGYVALHRVSPPEVNFYWGISWGNVNLGLSSPQSVWDMYKRSLMAYINTSNRNK